MTACTLQGIIIIRNNISKTVNRAQYKLGGHKMITTVITAM